jgi:hypothetical protein
MSSTITLTRTAHDDLAAQAAALRPDLASAFTDAGWLVVEFYDTLMTLDGVAFQPGDLALARPAVARHLDDFVVFSPRTASLVGLRVGEHFAFADGHEPAPR